MEFDDLIRLIGEFGQYQKWLYFSICLLSFPIAFFNLSIVFLAGVPEHRWEKLVKKSIYVRISVAHLPLGPRPWVQGPLLLNVFVLERNEIKVNQTCVCDEISRIQDN